MGAQPGVAVPTWGEGDFTGSATGASGGTPALLYSTAVAAGVSTNFLRTDDTVLFPTAVMSAANLSTLTLTDDAIDQTITGSLGNIVFMPQSNMLELAYFNAAGGSVPANTTVLTFLANSSVVGSTLSQGINGTVQFSDASTHTATVRGGKFTVTNTSLAGQVFSNVSEYGAEPTLSAATINAGGPNTWNDRTACNILIGAILGTQAGTQTDTRGFRVSGWPVIGTAGTYTNAYGGQVLMPTIGGTIRRGISLTTVTNNIGTEAANVEGFYCEDITRGTAQRANYYAEGATTGTPTDVYAMFQGTAHVVGTNRYGARFTGATTGTPTNCYGLYSDSHGVGTNRWSYWGSNKFHCDASDFIANASGFGFSNRDSQSSSAGGGGTARYWRIYTDASATGVAGDVTINIDSLGVITATRAGGATGTVQLILKDVGTAPVTT